MPPALHSLHATREARRSRTTILRDGSAVRVRPLEAGEEPALLRLVENLSAESLYSRFFGTPTPERAVGSLADCLRPGDAAIVAQGGAQRSIVAHAGAFRIGEDRAEAAFLVADEWQGRGLGSILLSRLAATARERGIATLVAEVLPGNDPMLAVFQRSGHPVRVQPGDYGIRVLIGTSPLAVTDPLAA
ncbi:MAG TPA: GNAT family N-acetyltransferase [Solirubrobacteraceae bacterium]|nr:GNAT family N-acetyltransferase [Solirubrobacteraceae bacterium]